MKIKFCGIRRLEDVAYCNDLQPDYLGMILSEGFRRTVPIETAAKLAAERRGRTALVGVFVDETPEHIAQVLKRVPLDVIQLHGSETAFREYDGVPAYRFGKLYGYKTRKRSLRHSSWVQTV